MRLIPGPGMMRLEDRPGPLQAREAAQHIALHTPLRPSLGLVLGSGWFSAAQAITQGVSLDYQDIPYFPKPHVLGHPGRLVLGLLSGRPVAALCGRPHLYEGYTMAQVAFPVLTLRELGVSDLILTNAAGGLNPSFQPGDLMLISDHINLPGLVGASPLTDLQGAFVDLGSAYDLHLREVAKEIAASLGERLHQGTYAMVGGPTYETIAEASLLRAWGADAVGMSTVPEVVMACWAGMRVLALSLITNLAPRVEPALTHREVVRRVEEEAPRLRALLEALAGAWPP